MREYLQTPIHVAPPVLLDKQTWPFIISLVVPELPASGFYLHYAQETNIHISDLNLFSAMSWIEKAGGCVCGAGVQGGRKSSVSFFL